MNIINLFFPVLSEDEFRGKEITERTLNGRFRHIQESIRDQFSGRVEDVEEVANRIFSLIGQWKESALERLGANSRLKSTLESLVDKLKEKVNKHALRAQIKKTTRLFKKYYKDCQSPVNQLIDADDEFTPKSNHILEKANRRSDILEFWRENRVDDSTQQAFDFLIKTPYKTLLDNLSLIERFSKVPRGFKKISDKPLFKEQVEWLGQPTDSEARKSFEKLKKAAGRFDGTIRPTEELCSIVSQRLLLQEAADQYAGLRKKLEIDLRKMEQASCIHLQINRNLRTCEDRLKTCGEIEAEFSLFEKAANVLCEFAPHLGWQEVVEGFRARLKEEQRSWEWNKKETERILKEGADNLRVRLEAQQKAVQPEVPKIASVKAPNWFFSLILSILLAIKIAYQGWRSPQAALPPPAVAVAVA